MINLSNSKRGVLLLAALAFLRWPVAARAQDAPPSPPSPPLVSEAIGREVAGVFHKAKSAVVKIVGEDAHGAFAGSGFFISPNGYLFTSYAVGGDATEIEVEHNGERHTAERVAADARAGVALLKIEATTPFLMLGKSTALDFGSPVVTVGYPLDLPATPGFGWIAGFDIRYQGQYLACTHLRSSVPVQRGQSGAPLLNMHGEVVGLVISELAETSGHFALPIEAAEKIRRDFLRFGEVRTAWLGLEIEPAAVARDGSMVAVRSVHPDGPSTKAGLKAGDVLLQFGDTKLHTPEQMRNAAFFLTAGDAVTVRYDRNGELNTVTITAEKRPSADDEIANNPPRIQLSEPRTP